MKIWFDFLGGNLFNDTEGIDVKASVERYAELVEEAIQSEYPGAEVEIGYQVNAEGAAGGVHVAGDQIDDNTFEAMQNEESIIKLIGDITQRVFNDGEWYVMAENAEEAN